MTSTPNNEEIVFAEEQRFGLLLTVATPIVAAMMSHTLDLTTKAISSLACDAAEHLLDECERRSKET